MSRRSVLENYPRPLPNPLWKLRKAQRRVPLCIFLIYRCAKELVVLFEALHVTRRLQDRSEEHTSELQSRGHLVCRLLLEKKKLKQNGSQCTTYALVYTI